jgi:hypothetical protein
MWELGILLGPQKRFFPPTQLLVILALKMAKVVFQTIQNVQMVDSLKQFITLPGSLETMPLWWQNHPSANLLRTHVSLY